MKVILTLKPNQNLPKLPAKKLECNTYLVTIASKVDLAVLRETYVLSRHAETPVDWSDDMLKPDSQFNPPGKVVVRNTTGKVIALQG